MTDREKDPEHTLGWDKERDGNMKDYTTEDDAVQTLLVIDEDD